MEKLLQTLLGKALPWRGGSGVVGVVVSYPKSGRTWFRVVFDDLGLAFADRHAGTSGSKPRPFDASKQLYEKKIYAEKPVVFLFRDPRDTVVSHFFWQSNWADDPNDGSLATFIRDPRFGIEKIVRFNLSGLEQGRNLPSFLPVGYEDIVAAPVPAIGRVLTFIGAKLPNAKVEREQCLREAASARSTRRPFGRNCAYDEKEP